MLARSLSLNSPHIARREAEYAAPLSVGRGLDFHLPRRQGRPPPLTTLNSNEQTVSTGVKNQSCIVWWESTPA